MQSEASYLQSNKARMEQCLLYPRQLRIVLMMTCQLGNVQTQYSKTYNQPDQTTVMTEIHCSIDTVISQLKITQQMHVRQC